MNLLSSLDWQIINWIRFNIIPFFDITNGYNFFKLSILDYLIVTIWTQKYKKQLKREERK